jgi:hypothetical protein
MVFVERQQLVLRKQEDLKRFNLLDWGPARNGGASLCVENVAIVQKNTVKL